MSVRDRIKKFVSYKDISMRKFESMCGLSNGYVNNIKTSIQPDKMESISLQFPELNTGWLMTGDGDMIKNPILVEISGIKDDLQKMLDNGLSIDDFMGVPYWNLPVSAGRSIVDITGKQKPDGYVKGLPGADIAEHILPVAGASMEPEISSGAIIGVRKMNNWDSLNTERIYLIITHDDRMIKRIEHDETDMAILWCVSPNYPKFKIYKSDIVEIQRVCFVYNPK